MPKLARYHNGQVVLELPILGSKKEGTLQLGHPEGLPRPEGADADGLKVGLCPVQADGELQVGCCRPITGDAAAAADSLEEKSDAGTSTGTSATDDAPAKGKKAK